MTNLFVQSIVKLFLVLDVFCVFTVTPADGNVTCIPSICTIGTQYLGPEHLQYYVHATLVVQKPASWPEFSYRSGFHEQIEIPSLQLRESALSEVRVIMLLVLPTANGLCWELVHLLCYDHNDRRPGLISCISFVAQHWQILRARRCKRTESSPVTPTLPASSATTLQYSFLYY